MRREIMRSILLIAMLAMAGVTVPIASADIYFWTDENGVKNFTNYSPPEKAEVFMETSEADEDTSLIEAETDRAGDADRTLESEQLQAATEEIEALREQVGELKDRLAVPPEAPSFEFGEAATEAEELIQYGSIRRAAMCIGRIRTATPLTDTRGITSLTLVMVTADRDTKNSLTTPTGLSHTHTGGNRLSPVMALSVRGRAIGPSGRERIAPAPVDNTIRSEGNRVSPAAKADGDSPVRLTTCCFRLHLWMDNTVVSFSETGQSKALNILLGVDAVAVAT